MCLFLHKPVCGFLFPHSDLESCSSSSSESWQLQQFLLFFFFKKTTGPLVISTFSHTQSHKLMVTTQDLVLNIELNSNYNANNKSTKVCFFHFQTITCSELINSKGIAERKYQFIEAQSDKATAHPVHLERLATSQDAHHLGSDDINAFNVFAFPLLFAPLFEPPKTFISRRSTIKCTVLMCFFPPRHSWSTFFVGIQCVTVLRFLTFNWKVKTLEHFFPLPGNLFVLLRCFYGASACKNISNIIGISFLALLAHDFSSIELAWIHLHKNSIQTATQRSAHTPRNSNLNSPKFWCEKGLYLNIEQKHINFFFDIFK